MVTKVREKTKLKLRSKRERLVERPQALSNLPTSVVMAAQQLMNGSHDYEERAHSARGRDRVVAQQPRSFRRIQSAHQVRWVVRVGMGVVVWEVRVFVVVVVYMCVCVFVTDIFTFTHIPLCAVYLFSFSFCCFESLEQICNVIPILY